jgi:hypothetical protein
MSDSEGRRSAPRSFIGDGHQIWRSRGVGFDRVDLRSLSGAFAINNILGLRSAPAAFVAVGLTDDNAGAY